LLQTAQSMILL